MAITRRQFVTRLGALTAALGMSQMDLQKITEAFAHNTDNFWVNGKEKPKVIWVHGAECTGCSTSLLSLFEDANAYAVEDKGLTGGDYVTTGAALGAIGGLTGAIISDPHGHRTLQQAAALGLVSADFDNEANGVAGIVNIADVLIDFISLEYHETVMGMGGDLAYQWLHDRMHNADGTGAEPFVLVVEGAVQPLAAGDTDAPWCSIAQDETTGAELAFSDVVKDLATKANCLAVIGIGQCATYGGYPACVSPEYKRKDMTWTEDFGGRQTPAQGVAEFLAPYGAAGKVVNVPGCPANPWWFILTVVLWLYDAITGPLSTTPPFQNPGALGILNADFSINPAKVDYAGRLKHVYGSSVHGPACPRFKDFTGGNLAANPGDSGCLAALGCKGLSTQSLCTSHGWNAQQPNNEAPYADPGATREWENGVANLTVVDVNGTSYPTGGCCTTAGAPCMGCTEKGYPDAYVPFVKFE